MTQPEAMRLADALDVGEISYTGMCKAAAELRWLHEINQELLAALHSISLASQDSGSTREGMGRYARAAIAKGEAK
jgi:hypothetical protein